MNIFIGVSVCLYATYALVIYRYVIGIKLLRIKAQKERTEWPTVSVVVALKNEETNVENLVKALTQLEYPGKFEVILLEDHSDDNTYTKLLGCCPSHFHIRKCTGNGKKSAIESGVQLSNSEWIAVTDADCEIPKTWLTEMISATQEETKMVLGPVFIKTLDKDILGIQKMEFLGLQGATAGSAAINSPISANGANMLFKRDVFLELEPYKDNLNLPTGDDQYLMMAIHENYPVGVTYALNNEAIIHTHPVTQFKKYWEQRIRWASKGSTYKQTEIIAVGLVVFLTSLIAVEALVFGLKNQNYWVAFGFILAKGLIDLPLIIRMSRFSKSTFSPIEYIASVIVYPFVVVLSVILGFFKRN